jgi:hypothetical protein
MPTSIATPVALPQEARDTFEEKTDAIAVRS